MRFTERQYDALAKACDWKLGKYFSPETLRRVRRLLDATDLPLKDVHDLTEKILGLSYSQTLSYNGRVRAMREIETILNRYNYATSLENV